MAETLKGCWRCGGPTRLTPEGVTWCDRRDMPSQICPGERRNCKDRRSPHGEEAETECPDDCAMCDGEFCATHGADPCDCDTADRHFSRPPQGEEAETTYSWRCPECGQDSNVTPKGTAGDESPGELARLMLARSMEGRCPACGEWARPTPQGAEPNDLVQWIDEVITEHQGPSAWLPDTMQVPTQLLRQVRSRLGAPQGAEVEALTGCFVDGGEVAAALRAEHAEHLTKRDRLERLEWELGYDTAMLKVRAALRAKGGA
ncbi:MAG: hypothetical protein AMXMBFR53_30200 [Gemmatimonadota bacterium]